MIYLMSQCDINKLEFILEFIILRYLLLGCIIGVFNIGLNIGIIILEFNIGLINTLEFLIWGL